MNKLIKLLLFVAVVAVLPHQAEAREEIGINVRTWMPTIGGDVKSGSEFNYKDTLGIRKKTITQLDLSFGEEGKWRFGFDSFDFKANKNIEGDYSFNGNTYFNQEQVDSKLEIEAIAVNWLPQYDAKKDACFSMVYGLRSYSIKTELNSAGAGSAKRDFTAFLPVVGVRYDVSANRPTSYYGELTGMSLSGNYINNFEVGFDHKFSSRVNLAGGYRALQLKIKSNDDFAAVRLSGPFAQFSYKF